MNILYENLLAFHWQDLVMIAIGCVMIFLAIKLMLSIVKKVGMRWFAVYTFLLGLAMIGYQMLAM